MARPESHVERSRRYVRIAQVAGVALAVSAAALWALELPGVSSLPQAPDATAPTAGQPIAQAPAPARLDSDAIALMAEGLEQARKKADKPKPDDGGTPPPPPPDENDWRYLGAIEEPGRRFALVAIEGRQRVLRPGRTVGATRLLDIQPEAITVDDGSGPREIALAERTGPSVSWITMPGAGPGGAALEVGDPSVPAMGAGRTPAAMGGAGPGGRPNYAEQMRLLREKREREASNRRMKEYTERNYGAPPVPPMPAPTGDDAAAGDAAGGAGDAADGDGVPEGAAG